MKYYKGELRSVDARRGCEGGWEYNATYHIDDVVFREDFTARSVLAYLRSIGYLTGYSKGRVRFVDEWPLIEIQDKGTQCPLLCILFDETPIPEGGE